MLCKKEGAEEQGSVPYHSSRLVPAESARQWPTFVREDAVADVPVRGAARPRRAQNPRSAPRGAARTSSPQASPGGHCVVHCGLACVHLLEAALEGRVLLDVLAVYSSRGRGPDGTAAPPAPASASGGCPHPLRLALARSCRVSQSYGQGQKRASVPDMTKSTTGGRRGPTNAVLKITSQLPSIDSTR